MEHHYDFLHIERHTHAEDSQFGKIKKLVAGIRYLRERVAGPDIKEYMPPFWALEDQLNHFNDQIGEPTREWIQEIMVVLDNEPQPDESVNFCVFDFSLNDKKEAVLKDTGLAFPQNILAEEWILERGVTGKYVVMKVIDGDLK